MLPMQQIETHIEALPELCNEPASRAGAQNSMCLHAWTWPKKLSGLPEYADHLLLKDALLSPLSLLLTLQKVLFSLGGWARDGLQALTLAGTATLSIFCSSCCKFLHCLRLLPSRHACIMTACVNSSQTRRAPCINFWESLIVGNEQDPSNDVHRLNI